MILRLPSLDHFLKELELRGPNVELAIRLAVRRPRVRGGAGQFSVWVRTNYLRDVGPPGDLTRTLVITEFEDFVGTTGDNADSQLDQQVLLRAEQVFNQIQEKAKALGLAVQPGWYTERRNE